MDLCKVSAGSVQTADDIAHGRFNGIRQVCQRSGPI